ncbi:MAG: Fic family protein [Candidatus Aenigmarchaeota archaeon]|nr:Fic family protein [Candidatus Aenigmarchaeota archaeon]
MPYHEIKMRDRKRYNYIVHTIRDDNKWKKVRKYIGEGHLSEEKIKKELQNFDKLLVKTNYLTEEQKDFIEIIRLRFFNYLKKGGKVISGKFNEWFFTELTYNSNAIEGSTANKRETSMIINDGVAPKNISLREIYEAKNHKKALEYLLSYQGDINEWLIKRLHWVLMEDIDEKRGKYRKVPVFILGSDVELPNHGDIPKLMKDLIVWYKQNKNLHPLELAALLSMKFVSVHPFTDGNGRVCRLLMNYILKKNNYPEINIYVKDRNNYLRAVRAANDGKYDQIIDFLVRTLKKNYGFLKNE